MKLDRNNLTIEQVMEIFEYYGDFKTYEDYPEDSYTPKSTYIERLVHKANHDGGASITEENKRIANEMNRFRGIIACLELGLFKDENQMNDALIEYGINNENLFGSDKNNEDCKRVR